METQGTPCRICGAEIPKERLDALHDTLVCVPCSKKIGGEFELKVTTNSTGKAGSLKRTGTDVTITRQRKRLI
jgi:hypothetical protein